MRSLHIIEPHTQGHRLQFVRRLVDAAMTAGLEVHLSALPESLEDQGMVQVLSPHGSAIRTHAMPALEPALVDHCCGPLSAQMRYWRAFKRHWATLAPSARGDVAFLPFADYCLHLIGLRGTPFADTPWSGITMRQDFHLASSGVLAPRTRAPGLKRSLFLRSLRHARCPLLFTLDPTLPLWLAEHAPRLATKVRAFEDPADLSGTANRSQARQHFGLDDHAIVILVYGTIDGRKGVEELIALMQDPQALPPSTLVLSVGRHDPQTLARIDHARQAWPGRWLTYDRYVDAQEEYLAMRAADWMWLGYKDFLLSSGCLAQAKQAQLPILATRQGLIGWNLAQARIRGLFCDGLTADAIRAMRKGDKPVLPSQADFGRDIIAPLNTALADPETA